MKLRHPVALIVLVSAEVLSFDKSLAQFPPQRSASTASARAASPLWQATGAFQAPGSNAAVAVFQRAIATAASTHRRAVRQPSPPRTMTVTLSGSESGSVTSSPAGIAGCRINCEAVFEAGTTVTLTATPGAGSTFTGWSGACGGTGNCTVLMNSDCSVTATFGSPTVDDVFAFAPAKGPSGTRVYIRGRGFTAASTVTFGTHPAPVTFVSATQLVTVAPLQEGALNPLPAGNLTLSVDGSPLGLFAVTELPQNPSPPGSVLTAFVAASAAEVAQVQPALETRLDAVLAATQDAALHDALADARAALPSLQAVLNSTPNVQAIPPGVLALMERQLLATQQSTNRKPVDLDNAAQCGVVNSADYLLCDRAGTAYALSQMRQFTGCDALSLYPEGPDPFDAFCNAFDVFTSLYSLLFVPKLASVTVQGPDLLANLQDGKYTPYVTTSCGLAPEAVVTAILATSLHDVHLASVFMTYLSQLMKHTGIELPLILCPDALISTPARVSPANFVWTATGGAPLTIDEYLGIVHVPVLHDSQTIVLKARLIDNLLLPGERDSATLLGCSVPAGCIQILLQPVTINSIHRIAYGYPSIDPLSANRFPRGGVYQAVIDGSGLSRVTAFETLDSRVTGRIVATFDNQVVCEISSGYVEEGQTFAAAIQGLSFALAIGASQEWSTPVTFDVVNGFPPTVTGFHVTSGVTAIQAGTPTDVGFSAHVSSSGNLRFPYVGCGNCSITFDPSQAVSQFDWVLTFTAHVALPSDYPAPTFDIFVGGVDGAGQGGTTGNAPNSPVHLLIPVHH